MGGSASGSGLPVLQAPEASGHSQPSSGAEGHSGQVGAGGTREAGRPSSPCLMLFSVPTHPASSPSPDGQDARRPRSRNPCTWTVEDVVWFVKDADPQALGPHVELFRKHVGAGWARPRRGGGGGLHGG